jgi:hypothetical protein
MHHDYYNKIILLCAMYFSLQTITYTGPNIIYLPRYFQNLATPTGYSTPMCVQ